MKKFLAVLVLCLTSSLPAFAQRVEDLPLLHAAQSKPMGASMAPARQPLAAMPVPEAVKPPEPLHDRVAAVVNDNIITTADINDRLKLAIISSNLPDTPEVERRLVPQILRGLIDEQLQLQEAKRLDITISKDDVDHALGRIAQDNGIHGDMRDFVRQRGGSPHALEQQLRAGMAWNRVIQRELRPKVDVGDDEVDAAIARIKANAGKEEFLVSEIFLAVDNPKDEDQVKQVADNLVHQIRGGASFGAIAHQFSQGTGAASGGDIGWIQEGQLQPELNRTLIGMQSGSVSDPVRTAGGYHILGLREKRVISLSGKPETKDVTINLQQAFLPFTTANHAAAMSEAANLRTAITDCKDLSDQLAKKFPTWHWQDLGDVAPDKVPPWLADKVRGVAVGKSGEPIATDKGALVVFVCSRHTPPDNENKVDREAIITSIGTEKLELQARRLLRDLRRSAYLDIKLNLNP